MMTMVDEFALEGSVVTVACSVELLRSAQTARHKRLCILTGSTGLTRKQLKNVPHDPDDPVDPV